MTMDREPRPEAVPSVEQAPHPWPPPLAAAAGAKPAQAGPPAAILLCVLGPAAGTVAAGALAVAEGGVPAVALWLLAVFHVLNALGIEVGFRRHFTHRAFRCGPAARLVLGSMAGEGNLRSWVAAYRGRHQHSDTPLDPHSPLPAGLRDAWRAHVGWMLGPLSRSRLVNWMPLSVSTVWAV